MRSPLLVAATLVVVLGLLVPLEASEDTREVDRWEEVMMYEVTPTRGLTLRVPAGTRRLFLDVVALVPAPQRYDPGDRYSFGFRVRWFGDDGRTRVWEQHASPRVSLEHDPPRPDSLRGTRLLFGDDWGTDPIQRVLPVDDLTRDVNGEIEVRSLPGAYSTLLLRAFAERDSPELLEGLRARRLPREERETLGKLGAGLGFADVPPSAIRAAVETTTLRLDAAGRRGVDYSLRRVQLSGYRAKRPSDAPQPPHFQVGPARWAAFNLVGPARLLARGQPFARVRYWLAPGQTAAGSVVLDREGRGLIALPEGPPSSLVLSAPEPRTLSLTLAPTAGGQVLGDGTNLVEWRRSLWLTPDIRRLGHARLRPDRPACYDLEPSQQRVRVQLRGGPQGGRAQGVWLRWRGAAGEARRALAPARLEPSRFEVWDRAGPASEAPPQTLFVGGARRVCLTGPVGLAARVYARDPGVRRSLLARDYRLTLPRDRRFRFAPLELHRWTALLATGEDGQPLRDEELIWLQSQVRLERRAPPRRSALAAAHAAEREKERKKKQRRKKKRKKKKPRYVGARVLAPLSDAPAQRLWVTRLHSGAPHKPGVWSEITDGRVVQGRDDAPTPVIVRALGERLPTEVTLTLDGQEALTVAVRVPVQRLSLPVPAGPHLLRARGEGLSHAYARALPTDFRPVHKLQTAHELLPEEALTYEVETIRGQALRLVLQLFTETPGEKYHVHYRINGVVPDAFVGRTQAYPAVRFFDRDFERKAGHASERVDLPPLSRAGRFHIELRSRSPGRVWVRAVLLGQRAPEDERAPARVLRRRAR